jgi:hypothetical protein
MATQLMEGMSVINAVWTGAEHAIHMTKNQVDHL